MIPVTRAYVPPFDRYRAELERIWETGQFTNNGGRVRALAREIESYLSLENVQIVANGTLALQLALRALEIRGDVITTPYTYVATATAIAWEGCRPVFVDIEDQTYCIDADAIEAAITAETSAIVATHVYGYPCNVQRIDEIAARYDLRVVYDAAHCFGVKLDGTSLLAHGDAAAVSFHATKVFHTVEGGAVACREEGVAKRIDLMKKFGHIGEDEYLDIGINAKMSEMHAAMGLCVLPEVDELIALRAQRAAAYDEHLAGTGLRLPPRPAGLEYNHGYYPVVFCDHQTMMRARAALLENGIGPRRYFYPSLNTLPYLDPKGSGACPVSERIAQCALALPLSHDLAFDDVARVAQIVCEALR